MESKVFCLVPWIHQMIETDGTHNLCCISRGATLRKKNGTAYHSSKDNLKDSWNSQHMRSFRKSMLDNKKLKECVDCYQTEDINKTSMRQNINKEWEYTLGKSEIKERIKYSIENDYNVQSSPVYLDLRLGNLCNLKCRMCHPYSSSPIAEEHFDLLETDSEYNKIFSDLGSSFTDKERYTKRMSSDWYESDFLWDELVEMIPNLRKVYLTGGEPTLIKQNYKFMETIIERGYSDKIMMFFNINGMNVNDRFLKLISEFSNIQINVSIDGVGKVNEYIRGNSDWKIIDENFKKLCALPITVLNVTTVIQIYNILDIGNLLNYIVECGKEFGRNIEVDFIFLTHPLFLNVDNLNTNIKNKCLKNLETFKKNHSEVYNNSKITKNSVDGLITLMKQKQRKKFLFKDFITYTNSLDKSRNQNFTETFPKLKW